jgi:hypothetical protein
MRSTCLGIAMLVSFVVAACAQSDDYRVVWSGPGGAPFYDLCRGSDVLIGFNYTAGSALNSIAGVCESQDNGITTGQIYGLYTRGIPEHGSGFRFGIGAAPRCPGAMAIHEMTVSLDKNGDVQAIDAICAVLVPSDTRAPTHIFAITNGTAVTNKTHHIACSSGDIAHGLIGQSGTLINGVGMQCATFPWSRVAVVTPPGGGGGPPPPTPHYVKVIVDNADVYSDCTGQTTIGHISAETSNQVTLKKLTDAGCNPEYYDLSWPGAPAPDNWVFSAPPHSADGPNQLDTATLAAAEAALGGGH